MAIIAIPPIELCPIHFGDLALFNRKIGNLDEVLLYSKICFHQQHSKISHSGKQCIARTRQTMVNWFGWSLRKLDALLASLEKKCFISKTVGLWKGIKAFFISAVNKITYLPINLTKLNTLTQHAGSVISSIIFSRIAFGMNNTKLEHEGLKWCAIKKEVLAGLAGIGIRTLDKILNSLQEKGLILKKNFVHRGKRQMHYHIPESVINTIVASMEKVSGQESKKEQKKNDFDNQTNKKTACTGANNATGYPHQNCRLEPAKSLSSIKEDQNKQKTKNITTQDNQSWYSTQPQVKSLGESGMHFSSKKEKENPGTCISKRVGYKKQPVSLELTPRQQGYISGAINRLIKRDKVHVSNPTELKAQLCYAVANDMHYKQLTFKHAVNRHAKIIASNNWRTPHGFYKYAEVGRDAVKKREEELRAAEEGKYDASVPTLPDHFKDLLNLDLSGAGQGDDTTSVNVQCVNADTRQNESCVSGNNKAGIGGQLATETAATGTTNLSQDGSMGLSRSALDSEKNSLSVVKTKAQTRVDTLNVSIARCQAKLATATGDAKGALLGLVQRLRDDLQALI